MTENKFNFRVILSSPLGWPGMAIEFEEVEMPTDLSGCISYVGHPATQALLEALGAVTDASNGGGRPGKYAGPKPGESYLAVPLASNSRTIGYTQDQAISEIAQLRAILCTRLDEGDKPGEADPSDSHKVSA